MRLLLVIVCSLVFVTTANAWTHDRKLDNLSSVFSQRPMTVQCASKEEDPMLIQAWGYTPRVPSRWVRVEDKLCVAALDPFADPLWRGLAISVIIHESYHQRLSWSARLNEGKVECQAIRHFRVGAQMLDATAEEATALLPYALFWYFQETTIDGYAYPYCVVPFWLPPGEQP
jgi:hypothetical protein